LIGDEVSETFDYLPGRFKVIRHIREKLSCQVCEVVVAASAPDHVIASGRAGAARPNHRIDMRRSFASQSSAEIFARDGVR
jgi:transposase